MADPDGQLARTYRFLGLEPIAVEGIEERVNATTHTLDLEEGTRRRMVELYESDVRALSKQFPDLDLDLWPNFANITIQWERAPASRLPRDAARPAFCSMARIRDVIGPSRPSQMGDCELGS